MGNLIHRRNSPDPIEAIRAIKNLPYILPNQNIEEGTSDTSFTVLSYNILADVYKNVFLFTIPCQFLDFNYRSRIIIEELTKLSADIICLQEVDHYEDFYEPKLTELGYELIYKKKDKKKDACVIGFKKNVFESLGYHTLSLNTGHKYEDKPDFIRGNIVIIASFKHKPTGKVVNVINTHLFWDPKFEYVKYCQMSQIMNYIDQNFNENDTIIWAGDFNSKPFSNTVNYVTQRCAPKLDLMDHQCPEKIQIMEEIYSSLPKENCKVKLGNAYSIYGNLLNDTNTTYPEFTNLTHNFRGTFDHIFYTDQNLVIKNLLKIPTEQEIQEKGLPNWRYPSDHLPLMVKFDFLDMKSKL